MILEPGHLHLQLSMRDWILDSRALLCSSEFLLAYFVSAFGCSYFLYCYFCYPSALVYPF